MGVVVVIHSLVHIRFPRFPCLLAARTAVGKEERL
jgi:hypothetical protein